MIIYEVAVQVDSRVFDSYVQWLSSEHIPEVIANEGFVKAELLLEPSKKERCRVLYYVQTAAALETYMQKRAPALQAKTTQRWGNQIAPDRSVWALYGTLMPTKR